MQGGQEKRSEEEEEESSLPTLRIPPPLSPPFQCRLRAPPPTRPARSVRSAQSTRSPDWPHRAARAVGRSGRSGGSDGSDGHAEGADRWRRAPEPPRHAARIFQRPAPRAPPTASRYSDSFSALPSSHQRRRRAHPPLLSSPLPSPRHARPRAPAPFRRLPPPPTNRVLPPLPASCRCPPRLLLASKPPPLPAQRRSKRRARTESQSSHARCECRQPNQTANGRATAETIPTRRGGGGRDEKGRERPPSERDRPGWRRSARRRRVPPGTSHPPERALYAGRSGHTINA